MGSATRVLWARPCGCGGPTLSLWPKCTVGAACRGDGGGPSPGGVACYRCEGRLVSGAVPPPAARPLARAAGAPRPVCPGCGRCGRGNPAAAPQRAPLRAGFARCGGGGRASPGGGAFHHCEGRLVSGAVPPPAARPLERAARVPVGGQSGEGQRLTSDAPHNGERHPPRGRPSATPTASNAGPQGRTRWGRCWIPTPAPTAPGTHGSRNPGCPLQRKGGGVRDRV